MDLRNLIFPFLLAGVVLINTIEASPIDQYSVKMPEAFSRNMSSTLNWIKNTPLISETNRSNLFHIMEQVKPIIKKKMHDDVETIMMLYWAELNDNHILLFTIDDLLDNITLSTNPDSSMKLIKSAVGIFKKNNISTSLTKDMETLGKTKFIQNEISELWPIIRGMIWKNRLHSTNNNTESQFKKSRTKITLKWWFYVAIIISMISVYFIYIFINKWINVQEYRAVCKKNNIVSS